MLDWLTRDQRSSYAESSHVHDAPETPAPLFAYRALRGVLFGATEGGESDDDNKENILPQNRSRKDPSKLKSQTPPRPTPRATLSPAKGILRTPGIPTPRRHNAFVTFKDVQSTPSSLSPGGIRSVADKAKAPKQAKQSPRSVHESTAPTRECEGPAAPTNVFVEPDAPAERHYNLGEIEAYIATTEREMKRLVRYGQRMREYARLAQEENATLKGELDATRKENEKSRPRQTSNSDGETAGKDAAGGSHGLFDLSPSSKQVTGATAARVVSGSCAALETGVKVSAVQCHTDPRTGEKVRQTKRSSPKPGTSQTGQDAVSETPPRLSPSQRKAASDPRLADMAQAVPRVQLPPDRLAAAKERLRLKSQERRKALFAAGEVRGQEHGSSIVDWRNL